MRVIDQIVRGETHTAEFSEALAAASRADRAAIIALAYVDDPAVRRSVALVLPEMVDGPSAPDGLVEALIHLAADNEDRVRDYACFGLGQQCRELDSEAIRDALAAHVNDPDVDTRCEALLGLAYRRDPRAIEHVRAALTRPDGDVWMLELRAAGALGDTTLHPLIAKHLDGWDEPDATVVDAIYRLTDSNGVGSDILSGVADLYRRRAHDEPENEVLEWWSEMEIMLDLAPHRATEFLQATKALLLDDPAATQQLLRHSALAQMADD